MTNMTIEAQTGTPASRSSIHQAMPTISIPEIAPIGAIEESLENFYSKHSADFHHLTIDLSRCIFLEASSLIYLVAFIKARMNEQIQVRLRIPQSKEVRDFLRLWKFPEALEDATNQYFRSFVVEDDHRYFGENANISDLKYASTTVIDGKVEQVLSNHFFSLTSFQLQKEADNTAVVFDEVSRWDGQLIKAVLKKHFEGPVTYFPSRIIFESITNALRHPKANIVQTASRFYFSSDNALKQHFTLTFWDDGDSIIDTLRRALREGKKIRLRDSPELYKNYHVVVEDENKQKTSLGKIPAEFVPSIDTPDELCFLAATFPGITRDIEGKSHFYLQPQQYESPDYALPGMGLFVLTNCVVDIFGGSVGFRTKNLFMNIKKATLKEQKEGINYRVKIQRYRNKMPDFLGNMLTIRLPLHRK